MARLHPGAEVTPSPIICGIRVHRFDPQVDSSHSVRQLAEYLLGDTLASKVGPQI